MLELAELAGLQSNLGLKLDQEVQTGDLGRKRG